MKTRALLLTAALATTLLAACSHRTAEPDATDLSSYYAKKGEQMSATMQPAASLNTSPKPGPTPRYRKLDILQ